MNKENKNDLYIIMDTENNTQINRVQDFILILQFLSSCGHCSIVMVTFDDKLTDLLICLVYYMHLVCKKKIPVCAQSLTSVRQADKNFCP